VIRVWVVGVVVHTQDDRHVGIRGRRGDDDLLRSRVEVLLRAVAFREEPRRLDRDVDSEVAPRQLAGLSLGKHLELVAPGCDLSVRGLDTVREPPVVRVVLEQMRHRLRVAEVVDRDDVELAAALEKCAEEVAPDPPETVDANSCRHSLLSWVRPAESSSSFEGCRSIGGCEAVPRRRP
jgi:hypothetical protein